MKLTPKDKQKFEANPALFLATAIKEHVSASAANQLLDYNNEPAVAEPVIGFADGRDPIFQEYKKKTIIGDFHLTPEEALLTYLERQQKNTGNIRPESISVISVAFTASRDNRLSNQPKAAMASPRWSYVYGRAFGLMSEVLSHVVSLLEACGYQAVAPVCTRPMSIKISPDGLPYTDWSEKHAAYAAGLGTFGLNTSLITAAGIPLHLGSVITDMALTPTSRTYDNYRAYCLYYRNNSCQLCATHCPSGAVNTAAFDGKKCLLYAQNELPKLNRKLHGETGKDSHPMCALCQIRVPCEVGIPPEKSKSVGRNN
jgi:epoxyqueuosine reductase